MPDQRLVMAVAGYTSKARAEQDLAGVKQAITRRERPRFATALVEKGADGRLTIDAHHNSAEHFRWGVALLGGPLVVVATPLGIRYVLSVMTSASAWADVGVIADHLWHETPREQLRQMSDLLEASQAALLVVALEQDHDAIGALLTHATVKVVTDSIWIDLEAGFPP